MITRQQYMADSRNLHHAYHLEIALEIGLTPDVLPADVATIREKLKTDEHLNNIRLSMWDAKVSRLRGVATAALKKRGDWLSLGTGVCILKAYAKHLASQP